MNERGFLQEFDPKLHQPVRLLVVCEKDDEDLFEEIEPVCEEFGAELSVTVGNSTWGYAWALTGRAMEDKARRPLVVLWLSDADLSGEDMPTIMARHIEFIRARHPDIPEIRLNPVALSPAQVDDIEDEFNVTIPKAPDPRTVRDEHGNEIEVERVELNALPLVAPGWLEGKLREALEAVTVEIEEPEVEGWDEPEAKGEVPYPNLDEQEWLLAPRGYREQLDVYRIRDGRGPLRPFT